MKRCQICNSDNVADAERCHKCGSNEFIANSEENDWDDPDWEEGKTQPGRQSVSADEDADSPEFPPRLGASNERKVIHTASSNGGKEDGTVLLADVWQSVGKPAAFKLLPINGGSPVQKSGDRIGLNRDDLDPGNRSISAGTHAELLYRNGSWRLRNVASNEAVFIKIQAGEEVELNAGTVIILGNRVYQFMPE